MKTRNSLSFEQQQQLSLSQTKSAAVIATTDFYLPDDCWESVFKFFKNDDYNNRRCLESLAGVSKQFLSIINRLRFSLRFCGYNSTLYLLPLLLQRFTNLVSIDLSLYHGDLEKPICEIARFPLKLTSLNLTYHRMLRRHAMRTFSQNITTLTSLTYSYIEFRRKNGNLNLIANCFPNLQFLDLNHCKNIPKEGIADVLGRCRNIRHLNLAYCQRLKLHGMNSVVSKLEVLNLSHTTIDDEALYAISRSCCGLLQLLLKSCIYVTEKGVKDVAMNCTQLREINLRYCDKVQANIAGQLIFYRPTLRKITAPAGYTWFSPQ